MAKGITYVYKVSQYTEIIENKLEIIQISENYYCSELMGVTNDDTESYKSYFRSIAPATT